MTYKRTIYVNDELQQAYEIAFRQGRNLMCRELDYNTHQVLVERLLTRFKRVSWFSLGKIHNRYIVLTRKVIEEEIRL